MTAVTAPRTAVGLRSERGPVLGAIMLTTSLIALDNTIIATAVPSVVKDIGGFSQFPWLFSIYLLTQAVTVPVYGKLADVLGRKPVLFFGVVVFVGSSLLCGLAWSMPTLIAARALQGIGAGAVLPIGVTIIGDLYSVEERARVQGYLASVWGASSVLGPALGGLFSEYLTWRWIFFINLPLGAVALWALHRRFKEQVPRRAHQLDVLGAALLTVGCSLLILGLLEGGAAWAWRSPTSLVVLGVATVALVLFIRVERRAAEPVLPLWVFRRRVLIGGNLVAVLVGALIVGTSSYVPTYVQQVLGTGAVEAGFALGALTIGWPIAASLSGRVYLRIGFRDTALVGVAFAGAGALLTAQLGAHAPVWHVAGTMFLTGLGMGFVGSPTIVAIQSVVGWDRRGVVTATNMFSRSMGSAIGAAVFGAIANATIAHRFAHPPEGLSGPLPHGVDETTKALAHPGPVADFARSSLYAATHHVFLALAVAVLLMTVAIALIPRATSQLVFDDD
ncbi:MAG TPA: MDR family MFS transporter [Mycobacteriales bacterium]|nr:MDR family MFS transporter [Mycobacteriales bacterium]